MHKQTTESVAAWLELDKWIALIEPKAGFFARGEVPDILAYHPKLMVSWVVEVKVGNADAAANRRKGSLWLGNLRSWAMPRGMAPPDEPGWGWLAVAEDGEVVEINPPTRREIPPTALQRERHLFAVAAGQRLSDRKVVESLTGGGAYAKWFDAATRYVQTNAPEAGGDVLLADVQKAVRNMRPDDIGTPTDALKRLWDAAGRGKLQGVIRCHRGQYRALMLMEKP